MKKDTFKLSLSVYLQIPSPLRLQENLCVPPVRMIKPLLHAALIVSFSLWLSFCSNKGGGDPSVSFDSSGKAQWIWGSENRTQNQWMAFRKQFSLQELPRLAVLKIAVDSKYWLWINGQLVVFEGALKRGPNPQDTWYDTVDIHSFLRVGTNTVAMLAWYWGKDSFSHNSSSQAAMIAYLQLGDTKLGSDTSWKVKQNTAYRNSETGTQPNFRLSEYNVVYDARRSLANWMDPDFDDQNWGSATTYGRKGVAPWNQLASREIPQWKNFGLMDYPNPPSMPFISNGNAYRIDLPYNAQITPYFKINSEAGLKVQIQTDAYSDDGVNNLRAEYISSAGMQEYESLGWLSGHSVIYHFPQGIEVLELKYRETGYNTEFTGSFISSDVFYDQLWKKARRTLYINMRDTFMDCPTRERAQWWGDVVNQIGEVFYSFDSNAHKLIKKAIYDLVNFQHENNTLYSPVPSSRASWNRELPSQMLNSIGEHGFWKYYYNTGDLDTLRYAYPTVKTYLSLYSLRSDGLINYRRGGWDWGDWGDNIDRYIIQTTMYYMALKAAKKMAQSLSEDEDINWYNARIQSIQSNFNRVLWREEQSHYRSPELHTPDDRANALAVVSGLASSSQYPGITNVLREQEFASTYMEKYVLEALWLMRQADLGLERMKRRYRPMVEASHSTLWEYFSSVALGTYNHGLNAPNTILSKYTAGVAATNTAWSTYHVLPQLGTLSSVQAEVPSVKGLITISIRKRAQSYEINLRSPPNTIAKVGIPLNYFSELSTININGEQAWVNGTYLGNGNIQGVHFFGKNEHFIMFNVGPGDWTISGHGINREVASIP